MNIIILSGNLVKDPEPRQAQVPCCRFTIAVQRRYKNQQGQYEADFIDCTAWRQTAEFVQKYFRKGQKIAVTGSLHKRTFDAQDGTKRTVYEVIVDAVEFVTPKEKQDRPIEKREEPEKQEEYTEVYDDLPF